MVFKNDETFAIKYFPRFSCLFDFDITLSERTIAETKMFTGNTEKKTHDDTEHELT